MYRVRREVSLPQPAEPDEMEDDVYSDEEAEQSIIMRRRKKGRLPGEKLLRRLAREREQLAAAD